MTRYDRQERINNWNQQTLLESEVVVLGTNALAHFVVAAAAALGFGHIRIIDNTFLDRAGHGEFLFDPDAGRQFKAEALAGAVERINPDVEAEAEIWRISANRHTCILGQPNLIVDTSNDPVSELIVYRYGQEYGIPVLNASARAYHSEAKRGHDGQIVRGDLSIDYFAQPSDPFTAAIAAALVTDEGRSSLLPLPGEQRLKVPVYYNMLAANYINRADQLPVTTAYTDRHALVIGAGALGNWVVLLLALKGVKQITIMDDDDIEEVNLNRQIMFTLSDNPIGRTKAEVLAEVVQRICPDVRIEAKVQRFDGKEGFGCDVIYRCTDSLSSSLLINDYALDNKLPVVYMGTEVHSAQMYAFKPGRNYCLDCLLNLRETLTVNPEEVPDGCLVQPNPSVVTTNLLAAGVGSNYFDALFPAEGGSRPLPGNVLKYNFLAPNRLVYPFGEGLPALDDSSECRCREWVSASSASDGLGALCHPTFRSSRISPAPSANGPSIKGR